MSDSDPEQPQTRRGDLHKQSDWTPRPDPTDLTTQALMREVTGLKALLKMQMQSMDDLMDQKFMAVDKEFLLIESRRVEQKQDTKAALDAALAAAKEAVSEQTIASEKAINKSESATDKRIDQLGEKFDTAFDGQRRDIDDVKQRIAIVEAIKLGSTEAKQTISTNMGLLIAVVGLLLSILLVAGDGFTR
jgi:hypothetical protein